MSTSGPGAAKLTAEGLKPRNITLVDAPVSGGIKGAVNGTLACHRVSGWWEDAGTQESLREIGALIERTGVNKLA